MKRMGPWFLLLCCGAAGCAPSTVEIYGRVTLDGAGVPDAQIQFVPGDTAVGPAFARATEEGTYRVLLLPGNYTVRILAQKTVPAPPDMIGARGKPLTEVTVDAIPEKYNANSDLRATVLDAKELNFDLTSEP